MFLGEGNCLPSLARGIASPSAVVVAVVVLLPLGVVGAAASPVVLRVVLLVVGVGVGRGLLLRRVRVLLHVTILLARLLFLMLLAIVGAAQRRWHRQLVLGLGIHAGEGLGASGGA